MSRRPRHDEPGAWHHVGNRALARRTFFEGDADIRFFEACLAHAVRRGEIEIHAYSILTTHFHLLVRSVAGDLAAAMQRVQRDYVRRFNRLRHRDGSLVRGRYWSRRIDSYSYLMAVIRYIDANAVQANLARSGSEWRYGSARCFAGRERTPRWLSRGLIEQQVCVCMGTEGYDPTHYDLVFRARRGDDFVVSRARTASGNDPQIDDLLTSAPGPVLDWLRRKTALADGSRPGTAVASPEEVREAVAELRRSPDGYRHDGWSELEVGLLRDLSGLLFSEAGSIASLTPRRARGAYERHHELLLADASYAERVAVITRQIVEPLLRGVPAGKMSAAYQVPYGRRCPPRTWYRTDVIGG